MFYRAHADDDTDALRVLPRGPRSSGYRNVYWHGRNPDGVDVWIAKVKRTGVLITLPGSRGVDRRACARRVAAWYAAEFGERWREALAARKRNPFVVKARGDRFYVAVWVCGQREEVVRLERIGPRRWKRTAGDTDGDMETFGRWKRTAALDTFATRADAKRGLRLYLGRLYGLFHEAVCWRQGAPPALARAA